MHLQPSDLLYIGFAVALVALSTQYEYILAALRAIGRLGSRYVTIRRPDDDDDDVQEYEDSWGANGSHERYEPHSMAFEWENGQGTGRSFVRGTNPTVLRENDHGPLSAETFAQIRAMIAWRDQQIRDGRPYGKEAMIRSVFGASKGGSEKYKAASDLYDVLWPPQTAQSHYPPLTQEQQETRQWLRNG